MGIGHLTANGASHRHKSTRNTWMLQTRQAYFVIAPTVLWLMIVWNKTFKRVNCAQIKRSHSRQNLILSSVGSYASAAGCGSRLWALYCSSWSWLDPARARENTSKKEGWGGWASSELMSRNVRVANITETRTFHSYTNLGYTSKRLPLLHMSVRVELWLQNWYWVSHAVSKHVSFCIQSVCKASKQTLHRGNEKETARVCMYVYHYVCT